MGDTARHFNVSKSTVHDLWHEKRHTSVPEAPEAPNVITSRVSPDCIAADLPIVLEDARGNVREAAVRMGIPRSTLQRHIAKEGINVGLYVA